MRLIASRPEQPTWEECPRRTPRTGEVFLRTKLSAVSVASELSALRDGPFPQRLGYQTLGVVEATGPDVTLPVGARVVSMLGHASSGVVNAAKLVTVAAHVPDEVALCAVLGEETHKGIRKVAPGSAERVLVVGAGLLGLLSVFNLTRRGVTDVTVMEPEPERRALAEMFGAAACAPGALPHEAFDVAVECSASPEGFAEALYHLRSGGRCAVLSDGNFGALTLPPAFHRRELTVVASSDGEDYAAYSDWLWRHADPVLLNLFPARMTPAQLPGLYSRLARSPRPVSVLVDWTGPSPLADLPLH